MLESEYVAQVIGGQRCADGAAESVIPDYVAEKTVRPRPADRLHAVPGRSRSTLDNIYDAVRAVLVPCLCIKTTPEIRIRARYEITTGAVDVCGAPT